MLINKQTNKKATWISLFNRICLYESNSTIDFLLKTTSQIDTDRLFWKQYKILDFYPLFDTLLCNKNSAWSDKHFNGSSVGKDTYWKPLLCAFFDSDAENELPGTHL